MEAKVIGIDLGATNIRGAVVTGGRAGSIVVRDRLGADP